jgi:uncharacterized membrane protein YgcG
MARTRVRWAARLLIVIGAILAVPVSAVAADASPFTASAVAAGPAAVVPAQASSAPASSAPASSAPASSAPASSAPASSASASSAPASSAPASSAPASSAPASSVQASSAPASSVQASSAGAGTVSAAASSGPAAHAVLTAAHAAGTPAAPAGGVCSVPGIGDIGGLLGLCSAGSSGIIGALNNVCQPSIPQPEAATGGIDALIQPPAGVTAGKTLYDSYGVAGQFWAAHGLQCSDMTSLIGNNVAGMVFDAAKSIDRVTITVYQSAAGNGILAWLQSVVDRLISALGNAIYFPYLAPVIILGAIWLAWNGLVRKRATRAIEGTMWMVVACAAAIWLIGRPADFTGVGTTVSNGVTQVLNVAFAKLPNPGGNNCVPVQGGDPQAATDNFGFTSSNGLVDSNANELWSVLVCKPWLDGELGTTQYATSAKAPQTVVNTYGRQLLWAQAIAANEKPTADLIQAKQATYVGIANSLQQNNPSVYALFQGNQWTTRLEIGFAALFAALVAGLLILLISLTLIILKLGFLLLLIAGPFFLIIGTHPGFGRIIAIRWFEMLVGVLMKQVAVALALSVLLYAYSLIMGTSDAVLPWALKILMIALVTVAVFIYRKPFQHLFSAVGYGVIGSQERADVSLREASTTFRRVTRDTATATVPGVAAYRVGRWARQNPGEAAALAAGIVGAAGAASAGSAAGKMAAAQAAGGATGATDDPSARVRATEDGQPVDADAAAQAGQAGARPTAAERARRWPGDADGRRAAPPLNLPPRAADNVGPAGQASAAWARGGAQAAAGVRSGEAPPRPGSTVRVGHAPSPATGRPAPTGRPAAAAAATPGPSAGTPGASPASPPPAGSAPTGSRSAGSWWSAAARSAGGRPSRPAASSSGPSPAPSPAPAPPRPSAPTFGGRPAAGRTSTGGNGFFGGNGSSSGNGSSNGNGASTRSGTSAGSGGSAGGPWSGAARPRWQPGPIRPSDPSGGWAGRPRSPEPPAGGPFGGSSGGGRAPSRNRARETSAPGQANGSRAAERGPSGPAAPRGGRDNGSPPPESPMPFWLRPVRRRK